MSSISTIPPQTLTPGTRQKQSFKPQLQPIQQGKQGQQQKKQQKQTGQKPVIRQQQTYKKQPGQQQVDKKSFKRVYGPLHYTDKNSSPDHQTSPTTKILQQKYKKQTGTQRGTLKQQSGKKQIEEPTNTTEL